MPGKRITVFQHPLSLFGLWLTTVSALLFLIFFFAGLLRLFSNPYLGIVFFLILPFFFVVGLVLMPVGVVFQRRRERRGLPTEHEWPRCDLNDPRQRVVAMLIAAGTLGNVVVLSLAAYSGIQYMDTVAFCGRVCHAVMKPEYTAYTDSPHARVACVECHIGPGAPWFVKSKLSGTRQVFAVLLNTYPRPIPSPVTNLRPARETCEECHWPEKFTGEKQVKFYDFADDKANTETVTVLELHVGGGGAKYGTASGIHWHMNPQVQIEYITTTPDRQTIPWVKVVDRRGTRVFAVAGASEAELMSQVASGRADRRSMDCMDCHNRPSHPMAPTAEDAVDEAMGLGRITPTLPFVKQQVVAALMQSYPSQEAADETIARSLRAFYEKQFGGEYQKWQEQVNTSVAMSQYLYDHNVFPSMKVTWGTYPNNIGHTNSPGCFRCHDDSHMSESGQAIPQDCSMCHTIAGM